jgi:proline racemase
MAWMMAWSVARMAETGQIRLGNRHGAREIFGSRFLGEINKTDLSSKLQHKMNPI